MSWMQNLFRSSPIRPMQEHMRAAVSCARQLGPLFDAMSAGDNPRIHEVRRSIDELEHEADRIKNEIRAHLPQRLLMAVERRDMLDILDAQDTIADTCQDIAEIADQRKMHVPEPLRIPLRDLGARVVATCEQAERVINELDELVEMGFKGREVTKVSEMIEALGHLESESDRLEEQAAAALFTIEDELGFGAYFWYQMIKNTARVSDFAERVGNRLRLLIAS